MPTAYCGYGYHYVDDTAVPLSPSVPGDPTSYNICDNCASERAQTAAQYAAERQRMAERLAETSRAERERQREREREQRALMRLRGRRFGVEIEFKSDEDADYLADMLCRYVPCVAVGYTHEVFHDQWKIVSDGSVEDGWELVSPPLYWDQREQVHKACDALIATGASIDYQCGLHVHHDVSDLSGKALKRFVLSWHAAQPLTDKLVAESRRSTSRAGGNQWCRPYTLDEVSELSSCEPERPQDVTCLIDDRYRALNLTCHELYGTVEVRQHQGTLNGNKIIAWAAYGQALIAYAKQRSAPYDPGTDCIEQLLNKLPALSPEHRNYLRDRVLELNPDEQMALAV